MNRRESDTHDDLLKQLTRIIRDTGDGWQATVDAVLRLGMERLGVNLGILGKVEGERYIVQHVVQPDGFGLVPGQELDLDQTYCRDVIEKGRPVSQHHVSASHMRAHAAFQAYGMEAYLGVPLPVKGKVWGALSFSDVQPRSAPFGQAEIEAMELLATWLGSEIARQQLVTTSEADRSHAIALASRFEAFMAHSPALKWATDEENRYIFVNERYAQVMGIDASQAIGQRPGEVLPAKTIQAIGDLVERSRQQILGDSKALNFHLQVPGDGHVVPLYVTLFNYKDLNGKTMVGGSAIDMSDVSRVEQELRESEERFHQVFERAPIGLAQVALDGKWIQVNNELCRLLGYPREELVKLDFQTVTHLDDLEKDLGLVDEVLKGQRQSYKMDKRYLHRQGHLVWGRLSVSLVRNTQTQEPMYFISQVEDITKQRQSDEELARRNADLETLLYVISHDLREPLRAIRSFSWIVREDYASKLDERGRDMLGRVIRGAERLDQLLADVLMLSRAQRADRLAIPVNARPIIDAILIELQAKIEETGANINIEPDLPTIAIDERWLKRALYNLLMNAMKFARPGQCPQITISSYGSADRSSWAGRTVGLVVSDRGPGVAKGMENKIFGLFQRGVGRDVPGTGAGLAIVAQIAERYGGRAWVESREGGGSRFIITFNP